MLYYNDLIIEGNAVYEIDRECQAELKQGDKKKKDVEAKEIDNRVVDDSYFYILLFLLGGTK